MDASSSLLYQRARQWNLAAGIVNITMNIDCSPEEARRLMGLPDLTPLHELYVAKMGEMMTSGVTPDMIEQMLRAWSPVGEMGMGAWKQLVGQMTGGNRTG